MIERVTTLSDIDSLRAGWRTLYANSKADNLFLSFDWCRNWFEHFGLGHHVALVDQEEDQVAAVALFERTPTGYAFIGNEHSAWPDLLAQPSRKAPFSPFLEYMLDESEVQSIQLRGCHRTASYLEQLQEAAADKFVCISANEHCTRAIDVAPSLDAYLQTRPSKVRKELKRKMRKFSEEFREHRFVALREGESEQSVIATVAHVESRSWKVTRGNAFTKCARQSGFYRNVYAMSLPETSGRLYSLEVNQVPVAFVIGAVHGSRFYALKTAYDESLSAHSPGLVLFLHLIEELARNEPNVKAIELLGSDSRWKRELATSSTELCDYELARKTAKSWARAFAANRIQPIVKAVVNERPELLGATRKLGHLLVSSPKRDETPRARSIVTVGVVRGLHNHGACVVTDDGTSHNPQTPRFTIESDDPFPHIIARFGERGQSFREVQHVAVTDQFLQSPTRRLSCLLRHPLRPSSQCSGDTLDLGTELQNLLSLYWRKFGHDKDAPKIHFVPQHLARISYSLRASGFEGDAAILSLGSGRECVSSWLGRAANNELHCCAEGHCPDSLGLAYEAALSYCGLNPELDHKAMAKLAASGDGARFSDTVSSLVREASLGKTVIDRHYFDHFCDSGTNYTKRFVEQFGGACAAGKVLQHHRDVAAAFQRVVEAQMLTACRQLRQLSGARRLVVCGWPTLNPELTTVIAKNAGFSQVYASPVDAADLCLGAAYYLHDCILGLGRIDASERVCLGCTHRCAATRVQAH